ncbi:hypothetical protein TJA_25030 [Thermus sp. LT1-2-5]
MPRTGPKQKKNAQANREKTKEPDKGVLKKLSAVKHRRRIEGKEKTSYVPWTIQSPQRKASGAQRLCKPNPKAHPQGS